MKNPLTLKPHTSYLVRPSLATVFTAMILSGVFVLRYYSEPQPYGIYPVLALALFGLQPFASRFFFPRQIVIGDSQLLLPKLIPGKYIAIDFQDLAGYGTQPVRYGNNIYFETKAGRIFSYSEATVENYKQLLHLMAQKMSHLKVESPTLLNVQITSGQVFNEFKEPYRSHFFKYTLNRSETFLIFVGVVVLLLAPPDLAYKIKAWFLIAAGIGLLIHVFIKPDQVLIGETKLRVPGHLPWRNRNVNFSSIQGYYTEEFKGNLSVTIQIASDTDVVFYKNEFKNWSALMNDITLKLSPSATKPHPMALKLHNVKEILVCANFAFALGILLLEDEGRYVSTILLGLSLLILKVSEKRK